MRIFSGCLSVLLLASSAFAGEELWQPANRVAWCIVPFDAKKRTPEQRVEMLKKLGFTKYAYDWRAEHLPSFESEIELLNKAKIELTAAWFPAGLNADAKTILGVLEKTKTKTCLWITMGDPDPKNPKPEAKVEAASRILAPIADAAEKIGCTIGLYNHGGWFGEPENQILILKRLAKKNVGIVYNLHHGHDQVARLPELIKAMKPYLYTFNLNGMVKNGDRQGQKIVPLGYGDDDVALLKVIQESGYTGPIGILGHTDEDAEARLLDNLDGLDWIQVQMKGGKMNRPALRTKTGVK
jgi:sugar phosphate isomerase/epimerase